MWSWRLRAVSAGALVVIGVAFMAFWGGYTTLVNRNALLDSFVSYTWVIGAVTIFLAALLAGSAMRSGRRDKSRLLVEAAGGQVQVLLPASQEDAQPTVGDERAIAHLEAIRTDMRDEIKRRIKQRDMYSIELTFGLGTLLALAFAHPDVGFDLGKVLIAAPLISIYFTVLILYSYRIHTLLARYLRERIEPELARLCGTSPRFEWEYYYAEHAVPGIRRAFFLGALWVINATSLAFLWWTYGQLPDFKLVLIVASGIYTMVTLVITRVFWRS